jgi:hypothetical protein
VASRIASEFILEVRYMLLSLKMALDETELMLGDLNTIVPSSVLKNKHDVLEISFTFKPISDKDIH